jgi:hypothetical protein
LQTRKRRRISKDQYLFRQRARQIAVYLALGVAGAALVTALVIFAGRPQ